MEDAVIRSLLEDLKSPDATVRNQATDELLRIWSEQKGKYGLHLLEQSQRLIESGAVNAAEALLTEVIEGEPKFAEAWNRRAVLYYLQQQYRKAIADCQETIRLNPVHFGALHGMGLCYVALGEYSRAIQTFKQVLTIQPYAIESQRLLLECNVQLS